MARIRVIAERQIGVPPDRVYRYLADYREHHHRFLPPAFSNWEVVEGGVGEGTRVRFRLTAGRRVHDFDVLVAEPEPGRVLTETDRNSTGVTTFTVSPEGAGSRVRFETTWQGARGFGGLMERLFAPPFLRRLFADELERLDRYAHQQQA